MAWRDRAAVGLAFLGYNVPIIVSLFSLGVAALSLYFTIDA
jgi:hypothetical protein